MSLATAAAAYRAIQAEGRNLGIDKDPSLTAKIRHAALEMRYAMDNPDDVGLIGQLRGALSLCDPADLAGALTFVDVK